MTELIEIGRYKMKTKLLIILVLTLFIFSSCNSPLSPPQNEDGEGLGNLNTPNMNINDSMINYDVYQLDSVFFNQFINDNAIDKEYEKDLSEDKISLYDIEEKYLNIWKDELTYSLDRLKIYLDDEDKLLLEENQIKWEESIQSTYSFDSNIISKYDIQLGTVYPSLHLHQIKEEYRLRTIRIKYLNYLLDLSENNNIDFKFR